MRDADFVVVQQPVVGPTLDPVDVEVMRCNFAVSLAATEELATMVPFNTAPLRIVDVELAV